MPWFDPRLSFNPAVHRIKQALFHAAVVTDLKASPLPPPHPEVIKYLEPPKRVLKRAHDAVEECKKTFKVKEGSYLNSASPNPNFFALCAHIIYSVPCCTVPRKVARQRKDGHVRAEDDEDDLLLLDRTVKRTASQSQSARLPSPSATLVDTNAKTRAPKKAAVDKDKMDVDSETEQESGDDAVRPSSGKNAGPLPTPARSQSSSSPPLDPARAPGRIIGRIHPLEDFQKNIRQGDIVSKAVEDLAWVVKDIVMRPFASRRQEELLKCMKALRKTALNVRFTV